MVLIFDFNIHSFFFELDDCQRFQRKLDFFFLCYSGRPQDSLPITIFSSKKLSSSDNLSF
jgi:hypothetical protein